MSDDRNDDNKDDGEEKIRERVRNARDPSLPGVVGSDVTPKRWKWLWPDHIPRGKVVEICGDPGVYKTGIAIDICARISTGAPFPTLERSRQPANILFFSSEDDVEDTLVPRAVAAGADLERIRFVTANHGLPGLPGDEKRLRAWIKSWNPAAVVFDAFDGFLDAKLDPNSNPHARRALLPLIRLGSETGLTSILIRHLNKDSKLGRAMYRSAGSIGLTAASRASFLVGLKPGSNDTFVFACTKLNGAIKPRSIAYQVVERVIDGDIKTQRVQWLGETAENADDLVTEPEPAPRGPRPDKFKAAKEFLRKVLADGASHPSNPIIAAGKKQRIAYRTLMDAAEAMNVLKRKKSFKGGWDWSLPDTPDSSATSRNPHGERDFSEDAACSATSSENGESREDAKFQNDHPATSTKSFSPNYSDDSGGPENAEDAEFRGAPDDADLY